MGLEYFSQGEFRDWWHEMDTRLLDRLDMFRGGLGKPVMISPADGALGRRMGPNALSRHNIDRYGAVQAVDIMLPDGPDMTDPMIGRGLIWLAAQCGFGGIGLYPEWHPHPGMHLDVRPMRRGGLPATWCRLGGNYLVVDQIWERLRGQPEENIA